MKAEWFCTTESFCCANWFCRIFKAEWFCKIFKAEWFCRIFSPEWFCRMILLRIFCRLILLSRIILLSFSPAESFCSYSPQKNSNPKSWDLYIRCSIYRSQLFGLPFIWGEWKQNDSARQNHSAELTQQNHSAAQNHSAKSKQDDSVLQNESLLILLEWEEEEFQKEMWTIALEKYS